MRINPIQVYKNIQQTGQVGKREAKGSSKPVVSQVKDQVTLSDQAKLFSSALQRAREAEDIRMEKVRRIQEQIQKGTYNIKASDIAERMLKGIDVKTE